jgi:hypothetical protein
MEAKVEYKAKQGHMMCENDAKKQVQSAILYTKIKREENVSRECKRVCIYRETWWPN